MPVPVILWLGLYMKISGLLTYKYIYKYINWWMSLFLSWLCNCKNPIILQYYKWLKKKRGGKKGRKEGGGRMGSEINPKQSSYFFLFEGLQSYIMILAVLRFTIKQSQKNPLKFLNCSSGSHHQDCGTLGCTPQTAITASSSESSKR